MKRFRRIAVFLDGSESDSTALAYAGYVGTAADCESLHCVHVHFPSESHGRGEEPKLADFEADVLARLPEALRARVRCEIHAGGGIAEILRLARDAELDLVIVGRRLPSDQQAAGSAFVRLARKAPCSVLVVPPQTHPHMSRVMVPVDFSESSRMALRTGADIARSCGEPNAELLVCSVFQVGYGYLKSGLDYDGARKQLEQVTCDKLRQMLDEAECPDIKASVECMCSEQIATAIYELAASRKMDLIVIGSRGLTRSAAILLGSNAERILFHSPFPVLVVKRKGETVRLLDVLLEAS